ncbi:50S ribosomal protein L29 [Sporichthya polymorpha]|uniref:50S ribosomal protein L29 n=1 Tax=Sporichthya polymorpha TaxID=35751 RepID=UPI00037E1A50|nr:50S ribosomal protein L29 [Sporichthya polymorpha]
MAEETTPATTSPTNKAAAALRELDDAELLSKLKEAKEELFNLRFQAATGQLESHGRLRAIKKEIARIYTTMRERELGITTFEGVA